MAESHEVLRRKAEEAEKRRQEEAEAAEIRRRLDKAQEESK